MLYYLFFSATIKTIVIMTLKEKFTSGVSINTIGEAERFAIKIEKIADDFAIGFAEWCLDENHIILNDGKELLEIYKKEKGL